MLEFGNFLYFFVFLPENWLWLSKIATLIQVIPVRAPLSMRADTSQLFGCGSVVRNSDDVSMWMCVCVCVCVCVSVVILYVGLHVCECWPASCPQCGLGSCSSGRPVVILSNSSPEVLLQLLMNAFNGCSSVYNTGGSLRHTDRQTDGSKDRPLNHSRWSQTGLHMKM